MEWLAEQNMLFSLSLQRYLKKTLLQWDLPLAHFFMSAIFVYVHCAITVSCLQGAQCTEVRIQ